MSTGAAVIVMNSFMMAQNSANRAREREKKIAACDRFMPQFSHAKASIQERRSYAECVDLKYPAESQSDAGIWPSVVVGACILLVVVFYTYMLNKD